MSTPIWREVTTLMASLASWAAGLQTRSGADAPRNQQHGRNPVILTAAKNRSSVVDWESRRGRGEQMRYTSGKKCGCSDKQSLPLWLSISRLWKHAHCSALPPDALSATGSADTHTKRAGLDNGAQLIRAVFRRFWRAILVACALLWFLLYVFGPLRLFLLLFCAITGIIYRFQDVLVYFPNQPESSRLYVQTPNTYGLHYENVYMKTTDDVRINAFFIKQLPPAAKLAPTVLYFHGNAGNIGHRLQNAKGLYNFCRFNVFLVEYRGYGKSTGKPSESGLRKDAEAAMSYLLSRPDIDTSRIIVFGRSLGGAVAIDLLTNDYFRSKAFAIIVENTFTSIPALAKQLFPITRFIPRFMFRNNYANASKMRLLHGVPALFLSGQSDELIPPWMMTELFVHCGSPIKDIERFDSGTHNMTWQCRGYYDAIASFVAFISQSSKQPELSTGDQQPPHGSPRHLRRGAGGWGAGTVGHNLRGLSGGQNLIDVWKDDAVPEGERSAVGLNYLA